MWLIPGHDLSVWAASVGGIVRPVDPLRSIPGPEPSAGSFPMRSARVRATACDGGPEWRSADPHPAP